MLGPPGAGKGTQAERLAAKLGVPTISVGALLRAARLNEAERQAQAKGELLADTTVMRILGEELFRSPGDLRYPKGFILDGMPRSIAQVALLETLLAPFRIKAVVLLEVPREVSLQRLLERGKTSGRPDDANRTVIERRLDLSEATSRPIIAHYEKAGLLVRIDSTKPIPEVAETIATHVALKGKTRQ
ncbi:MAG: hypothetical protein A2284_11630 [Deltaproteobacteria bacterium RIFOXYA12_FULL_61_11]|nr:MAG: hypothetical protein A2284_11630 [Deltaproteobacteria bacterium RIFOXYA12_FULL_61_11]